MIPAAVIATLSMALAAPAQAAPHWYGNGKLIVGSVPLVKTKGPLIFHLPSGTLTCSVNATGTLSNPPTGDAGTDEMPFQTKDCKGRLVHGEEEACSPPEKFHVEVEVARPSHLAVEPSMTGIRDVLEGVFFGIRCSKETKGERGGNFVGSFTGTLNPKVGSRGLEIEGEALEAEIDYREFTEVTQVTVTGNHPLKGKGKNGKKITAA